MQLPSYCYTTLGTCHFLPSRKCEREGTTIFETACTGYLLLLFSAVLRLSVTHRLQDPAPLYVLFHPPPPYRESAHLQPPSVPVVPLVFQTFSEFIT